MAGMHVRARWLRAGTVAGAALAAALAGCSDDNSAVLPDPGPAPRPEPPTGAQAHDTGVTPVVPRVELDFDVNGAFRPGVPITVTAVARARRQADEVNLELVVHDEPDAASGGWRNVGSERSALNRGAEHRMTRTLTFPAAGYYRVTARAFSSGPTPAQVAEGDSLIMNASYETLYILVDANGGRLTSGFDPSAVGPGRLPMFGSYGPFVSARTRASAAARLGTAPGGISRQTTTSFRYYLDYDNQDTGTRRPLAGAEAEIKCLDAGFNVVSTQYFATGADGSFAFTCASGYFDGVVRLRDIYSEVMGAGQAVGGVSYFNEGTANGTRLVAANQYAAHVFATLRQYVPTAESRFGNRWRARLPVLVHATDAAFPIHYEPTQDTMRTNYSRVFGEDGRFVTLHEYGHAYHHRAIERWASYYCSPPPGTHYTHLPYTLSCAYVEGFATFFAVWMAANELTTGQLTDNGIETQTHYLNGDGVLIEGSVAGFLYDLVDGTAQRDNTANSGAFEETWDTAAYPGSFIADVMANCAPWSGTATSPVYTYYLDGADQLVYCMEGSVNAETQSPAWRTTWNGVTRSPTFSNPAGYSATVVRTIWRRNFYGVS